MVGAVGLEPTTPCSQSRCASQLRHAPTIVRYDTIFPMAKIKQFQSSAGHGDDKSLSAVSVSVTIGQYKASADVHASSDLPSANYNAPFYERKWILTMIRSISRRNRPMRSLAWVAMLLSVGAVLSACGTWSGPSSLQLGKDLAGIEQRLDQYAKEQASSNRGINQMLQTLDEELKNNNQIVKTTLNDLGKSLREQTEALEQLRAEMQHLSISVNSLTRRIAIKEGMDPFSARASGMVSANDRNTTEPTRSMATTVDQALSTGIRKFNAGDFQSARESFRVALEQDPEDVEKKIEILFWLAETGYKLEDYDAALDHYNQLIREDNAHPKAWVSLERMANIRLQQGDAARALSMLDFIEREYPDYEHIDRVRNTIERIRQQMMGDDTMPSMPATTVTPTTPPRG